MKAIHWTIAAAALVCADPAQAAVNDPEVIIYRFPGVRAAGPDNTGVQTSFHCTNFSGLIENIRFVTRDSSSALKSNFIVPIVHLGTVTVSTHFTAAYAEHASLNTGVVTQGTTAIAATSINIIVRRQHS